MQGKRTVISKSNNGKSEMVVYRDEIGKKKGKMKYSSVTRHERI